MGGQRDDVVTTTVTVDRCMFHSKWTRCTFQHVMNSLRGTIIPIKYVCKISPLVCVCNDKADPQLCQVKEDIVELKKFYDSENTDPEVTQPIKEILVDLLSTTKNPQTLDSRYRFLKLVKFCLQGEFDIFEPPRKNDPNRPIEIKQKETKVMLDLAHNFVGFFVGSTGAFIKGLQDKYKCKIRVVTPGGRARNRSRFFSRQGQDPNAPIKVLITWNGQVEEETVKAIQNGLTARAQLVTQKREAHNAAVEAWFAKLQVRLQAKRAARINRSNKFGGTANLPLKMNMKMGNTMTYESKYAGQKKDNSKRGKSPPVTEGYCVHCHGSYDKAATGLTDCSYHSGYIVERTYKRKNKKCGHCGCPRMLYMWTCCGQTIAKKQATCRTESHKETGCCNGRHLWRIAKKNNRKQKTSQGSDEDM